HPTLTSPTNGATGQSLTPTFSWTAPSGSVSGSTTYTVSIWDPYGSPSGHLLANLPTTTNLSITTTSSEGLLYGQSYYWNVNACNGSSCSGYGTPGTSWNSFTTMAQPAATLSGTGLTTLANPL